MTEKLYYLFLECKAISTDTRHITPGSLFFALKGPNFNANEFAAEALQKGARFAVIDEEEYQKGDQYILVDDVLEALQKLANYHRKQLNIPVLAITGSNGKTTTKELIKAVLSEKYKTLATAGNLNNHIGVPLTLLSIDEQVEIAIIEMGANAVGEIDMLCHIAEPDHGIITNIGKAHTGGFGGFEGVIRGKSELYNYLLQHSGTVFINSRNEILGNMGRRFTNPYYYPAKNDFYACKFINASPYVVLETDAGQVETKLVGKYNFENIAAALCIGKYFKVSAAKANEAVSRYAPSNNRSQIVVKGSNTIILDAYNANPSSMKAALENLKSIQAAKKVAILGDMNELGEESEEEHRKLGQLIANAGLDQVFFCGKLIQPAMEANPGAEYFENREQLAFYLETLSFEDTTLLIKASRSVGLEKLTGYIK